MRRLCLLLVALTFVVAATPANASNDPFSERQWNLAITNTPAAWTATSGAGIRVGIVDSGIDAGHEDLQGRIAAAAGCLDTNNGASSECVDSANDGNGHGTHVAGIVAANRDNGKGVAGVAPSAQLVIARVFDDGGNSSLSDVQAGAAWAIENGARVVNFSLGDAGLLGTGLFTSNSDLIALANGVWNAGAIPVFAAGNGGRSGGCSSWSGVAGVIVASTGASDQEASYSCNASSAPNGVGAPGGDGCDPGCVFSTYKGNAYRYIAGTSQAAPAVSGALALLLSQGLSREAAVGRLLSTADSIGCGACAGRRINVGRAVCGSCTVASPPPPPAPTPTAAPRPVTVTTRRATQPVVPAAAAGTGSPATQPTVDTTAPPETTTTEAATTTTTGEKQELAAKQRDDDDELPMVPAGVAALGLIAAVAGISSAGMRQRVRGDAAL